MMYSYIGQAKKPADYIDDLLSNFVQDDADFAGNSLIDKTPDYKNRLFNGARPFPASLAAELLDASDPMRFSAYINDNLSDELQESLEKELSGLGIDINGIDVADKCAKLFVSILTETARQTKRKDTLVRYAANKQQLTGVPLTSVYVVNGKIVVDGQDLKLYEKITPPDEYAQEEMPYISALFSAYAQSAGVSSVTKDNLHTLPIKYQLNFKDQRENYYNAVRVERSVKHLFVNGDVEFDMVKKDVYDGIIDLFWNDYEDGFKRMLAVLNHVSQITLTKSYLTQIRGLINISEKKGICHMLVNDGKIKWVLDNH